MCIRDRYVCLSSYCFAGIRKYKPQLGNRKESVKNDAVLCPLRIHSDFSHCVCVVTQLIDRRPVIFLTADYKIFLTAQIIVGLRCRYICDCRKRLIFYLKIGTHARPRVSVKYRGINEHCIVWQSTRRSRSLVNDLTSIACNS